MDYLREEQYYADLYDLSTIERCLQYVDFFSKRIQDKEKNDNFSEKEQIQILALVTDVSLYFIKGERYAHRKETIENLFNEDKKRQDLYDNTPEPTNIYCDSCGKLLRLDLKHLEDYENTPWRILFYFPCTDCRTKKAIYNTGEEYVSKPELCEKCGHEVKRSYKRKGKVITTLHKCIHCDFSETEAMDLDKSDKEWKEKQQNNRELLEKRRHEFCMSEKEGSEYLQSAQRIRMFNRITEEQDLKNADPAYHRSKKLKKLSTIELEKKLNEVLEKEDYVKLSFDKPEIDRYVIIPFMAQDAKSDRTEQDSTNTLRKLIKNTLEHTNWRIMSDGASYRLGYVYGRLKGYEREEDLIEIARKKGEKKTFMRTDDSSIY